MAAISIFGLDNYQIGCKDSKGRREETIEERRERLLEKFRTQGLRRVVVGVLLVHLHGHPHLLLLQDQTLHSWHLPGGRLAPGETDKEGLCRKLSNKLAPTQETLRPEWEVGDSIAIWWRPSFDTLSYQYIPAHISKPKECTRLFLIHLPEKCTFAIPKIFKLVAIPMYELYDNAATYGPIISSIPQVLSKYKCNFINAPAAANKPATQIAVPEDQKSRPQTAQTPSSISARESEAEDEGSAKS